MNKKVLVLGAGGGIGSATVQAFDAVGYDVVSATRKHIDFNDREAQSALSDILDRVKPQIIVNATGVFRDGVLHTHHETFDVNFGSNWNIICYYSKTTSCDDTKIIMIGSSSFVSGRSAYPLYSASKAALFNLWQSSQGLFANKNITVHLINPMRTRTAMNSDHYDPTLDYLEPQSVAKEILGLASQTTGQCINMTLEKNK